MHLAAYATELRYILRAPQDARSRLTLLAATARQHLENGLRLRKTAGAPIELSLDVGGTVRRVTVRPSTGDLFILYEIMAREIYRVAAATLDPSSVKTVVDCGANIGMSALYFASRYPSARIISIEPDPANFELLVHNTRDEPRIAAVRAAVVGTPQGPVRLTQDRPAWGNRIADAGGGSAGIEVRTLTMGQVMAEHAISSIDLLKVDIEGAEQQMFSEPGFLDCVRYVLIELHEPYDLDGFRRDVARHGFEVRPFTGGLPRAVTAFPSSRS